MKTSRNFRWNGAVHETVIPEGNIIYSDVVIRHRKCGKGDPDRNLRIYEKMLAGGEKLEPRHQLYYGREKVRTGSFFVQSDYGCAEGGNLL